MVAQKHMQVMETVKKKKNNKHTTFTLSKITAKNKKKCGDDFKFIHLTANDQFLCQLPVCKKQVGSATSA